MKASDLFVKSLENEGVEYIFGIPGEENLDLLESLRHSKIKLVITRHEQAAGFMAAIVGRLTGKPGVCISTLGPGATNFTTPSAYAQLGGFPMMMITGQKPIKKSKQGKFQIIDVVEMMRPITKYTKQITHGNKIPSLMRDAFGVAQAERPGAVHFEFPEDIAREDTDAVVFPVPETVYTQTSAESVKKIAEIVKKAKSPLLLVGAGGNRNGVWKSLQYFVEKTGFYFLNTQMGKGAIDERSEKFIGTTALSANDHMHCAIEKADLIIVVGHDPIEKPPFIMSPQDERTVIHVNYSVAPVDEIYCPQVELVGDVASSMERLADELAGSDFDFSYFAKVKTNVDEVLSADNNSDLFPIIPQRIVADVRECMPSNGIVCLDNGMYKIWFARHYKTYEPNTLLLDNALASMGAGLPSAMAAKLINPDKKVIAVCGDGGFMMNSQELETALRMKLNIVILVLNDSGYGMIKWKQGDMGFENFGLEFGNPDFVKYAESYGAHGYRVEKLADLKDLLSKCLDADGVHLIEVPIDYKENEKVSGPALKKNECPK